MFKRSIGQGTPSKMEGDKHINVHSYQISKNTLMCTHIRYQNSNKRLALQTYILKYGVYFSHNYDSSHFLHVSENSSSLRSENVGSVGIPCEQELSKDGNGSLCIPSLHIR